jgi:LysR family glycine cleavage system transcriptional activator
MAQRLPSLNALRAFEAVARHRSLSKAARELHVTPAAVSHQIKALEADLGTPLLRRHQGEFVLSEAAQAALPVLRAAFDQIAEAARRLRIDDTRHFLTISVGPTFASTWLVRRLGRFKETFPGVEVRLDTTDALADFLRDGVDVGIRFGSGKYTGLEAVRLFAEEIYPVCSPDLLKRKPPLTTPADLTHQTLLHVEWGPNQAETYDWQMWLRAAGAEQVDHTRGPRLSRASIALQAAVQGEGVALGSDALSSDELASGRLVRPFDIVLPLRFAYYLVYPQERARMPKIAAFRQWILAEAGTKASLG